MNFGRRTGVLSLGLSLLACASLLAATPRVTGDTDGDGAVTTSDIFYAINFVASSGAAPVGYGDVNGDAATTQADVTYLGNYLLAGGPRPMEPWRLLEQSTFGPTDALETHVRTVGFNGFLNEQFAAAASGYADFSPQSTNPPPQCLAACQRDNYTPYLIHRRFFTNALYGNDQLRQRAAWALHKILVVSGDQLYQAPWLTPYVQLIDRSAFGNYRQLLYDLTLNTPMGFYLDMSTSTRVSPNENYAREILQLFSVGTVLLNFDGTPQLDANGNAIPTYDQSVVDGFTKVFTGWAPPSQTALGYPNFIDPLVPRNNNSHNTETKLLLSGVTLPSGQTLEKDLNDAIDNIFNHPNVGPFISKQLIQSLVTSNPSPAYVGRVAAKFNNNGSGVRGDLKEVVRAILLDAEARDDAPSGLEFGHLREPVLFLTGVLRAFNPRSFNASTTSDGYLNFLTNAMGQNVFRPATVFSYFPSDYAAPGTGNLAGPEFGIMSASTALARANAVNTVVFNGIAAQGDAPDGTSLDFSGLQAMAANPSGLVDELNRKLMHGTMSAEMRNSIVQAVTAVPGTNTLLRAQQAVYLVCTSSQYQVER
jgi:uncharacterized protein (DUF1800 family)